MKVPEIIHLEETVSTNTYMKDLHYKGLAKSGCTVYTDFQTAGRGQKGNSWESARGENLLFSTILYPQNLEARGQFILSQTISLAILDVLNSKGSAYSIKWPNDIYWNEKKIAGILIENEIMDGWITQSIIGVGLNLNQALFLSNAPNPISLKQITGETYYREDILVSIISRLMQYFKIIQNQGRNAAIRNLYRKNLFRNNGLHCFEDQDGHAFKAQIYDVEDSGLLVLKTQEGDIRKFAFKEVKYIL